MYDIRVKDGKLSLAIDGCPPIHHVDFLTGQRIVTENLPLVLQQRLEIEKAIMHLYSAHIHLCLALRRKETDNGLRTTKGEPDDQLRQNGKSESPEDYQV